jgi:hypothetical protein
MIDTAISIGYVAIVVLSAANLYYVIRLADRRYDFLSIFDRFKREKNRKTVTWGKR